MSSGDRSMIYAQVEPERIADVNWIMEGYEHLALVGTIDGKAGIVKFYATPDTFYDVIDILENMPFKVDILEEFCEELI
ncbi:MAG: DUF4911 domain-containing protein [Phascolarctobacterium sp.]|nr:DUF4911 domain-containing protein [Phascolarctobacterium sp.]MBQ8417136.1 DUF4911 domain-containing protein [Phascolarctobacterium sp.]